MGAPLWPRRVGPQLPSPLFSFDAGGAKVVKVEGTFTLHYPMLRAGEENAQLLFTKNDVLPSSMSEWSLRVFSDEVGTKPWDPEVVRIMDRTFHHLTEELLSLGLLIPSPSDTCNGNGH